MSHSNELHFSKDRGSIYVANTHSLWKGLVDRSMHLHTTWTVDYGPRQWPRHNTALVSGQSRHYLICRAPAHQARLIWHLYYILHSSTATVQHPPGRLGMATVQHPPQQLCGSLD